MSTTKLDVTEFGKALLDKQDLDPVYTVIWGASKRRSKDHLTPTETIRLLTAYWCFYHLGVSAWIVDQGEENFWLAMERVADNTGLKYPRGTERRHFRGKLAWDSVAYLKEEYRSPENLFHHLTDWPNKQEGRSVPAEQVMGRVETLKGFGPWIGFKVADMLERLDYLSIDFDQAAIFMFSTPKKGAKLLWEMETATEVPEEGLDVYAWAVDYILEQLDGYDAPPRFERSLNLQEAETVLCKWKSHMGGHYPPGKDCKELWEALLKYRHCRTTQILLRSMMAYGCKHK